MGNENTDTSTVIEENTQPTSSETTDVKQTSTPIQKQESEPVKPESEESDTNITKWGGHYPIHKNILDDIRKNTLEEFRRKGEKEGIFVTDEIKSELTAYSQIMETMGSVLAPGETVTKEKVESILSRERKKAIEGMEGKVNKLEKSLGEMKDYAVSLKQRVMNDKLVDILTRESLKHGIVPGAIDDLVESLSRKGFVRIDENDMKTPYIVNGDGEVQFDKDGNRLSVSDYVKKEIESRPYLLNVADNSGLGGINGRGGRQDKGPDGLIGDMINRKNGNVIQIVEKKPPGINIAKN